MKYQAYPEYKDSGIEWLGDVPPHWVTLPLKRVCSLATGLTPPTSNEAHYIDYDSGRPWIRPDDLNEEGVVTRASKFLSQSGWGLMKIVPKGSTLICCIGTIGKAGYIDVDVSTNQQITSASFRQNPRYYYYLVRAAKKVFEETATGNVIRILNSERLGGVPFLSVPIDEAKKIADFLDHETAKIDTLIEKQQQLITLLKEKRQAVISHAVTKGLNPDAPMRDSGVEWLGEVPEHWVVKKFTHCATIRNGQVDPTQEPYCDFILVAPNHIESGTGRLIAQETAKEQGADSGKYLCKKGEVIYSKIRPALAKVCMTPNDEAICSADMYPIQGISGLTTEFLFWSLLSTWFTSLVILESDRVAMPKINREKLADVMLPVPPENEQKEICGEIGRNTTTIDNLVEKAEKAMSLLQERRAALISAAVTGKIDVRNWQAPTQTNPTIKR